tara:strand:+ start:1277 stop:1411 length:135 start_codon:yes stop_codon:yes gene_type:complete
MSTRQARRQENSERLEQEFEQWNDELREEYCSAATSGVTVFALV